VGDGVDARMDGRRRELGLVSLRTPEHPGWSRTLRLVVLHGR
jgi:hypothetical protein